MIELYSLVVAAEPGNNRFFYKGESFPNIKTLVEEIVKEGLSEEDAIKIIAKKSRTKRKKELS